MEIKLFLYYFRFSSIELGVPAVTFTMEGLVEHNSNVVMTFTTTGDANPSLSWINEKRIKLSNRLVLTLNKVNWEMSGSYICEAVKEGLSKYSRPIILNVTCKFIYWKGCIADSRFSNCHRTVKKIQDIDSFS